MEERNIKVTIEKARDWYNSGNNTLKEIALQAFSKEELEIPSIASIINTLRCRYNLTEIQRNQLCALKNRSEQNISAPKLLRILAMYFNDGWKKEIGNSGYFLTKTNFNYCTYAKPNTLGNDWSIVKHESVCYPVTYFKSEQDCKKAFQILKDLGKLNNLYEDL